MKNKLSRPSVGMYSHGEDMWYIIDMNRNIKWFKELHEAEHMAFNNFLDYSKVLEDLLKKHNIEIEI